MKENAPKIKKIVFEVEDNELGVCLDCPRQKFHGPYRRDQEILLIGCKGSEELVQPRFDLDSHQSCSVYYRMIHNEELNYDFYHDNPALLVVS